MEKKVFSYTVDRNVCSHYGEQYEGSLKIKNRIDIYDPAILLLDIYPEKCTKINTKWIKDLNVKTKT